jgi:hypothetical protein
MTKHKPAQNPIKTREAVPLTRKGSKDIYCPFCTPSHIILPNKPTTCGTEIHVKAIQYMITQRTAKQKGITCMKCHKDTGGNMVACMQGFIHAHDCAPGTIVLSSEPEYSKMAEHVYRMPDRLRKMVEKKMGEVKQIKEIDAEGNETGKINGYFFYKNDV